MDRIRKFRARLRGGEPLAGTFVKTPSPVVCELLALAQLDVLCLDTEHAPFGRLEVDGCIAALRAADQPSLVRIGSHSAAEIRNALDCGATGVLVPHVTTADQAAAVVRATRFGEGGRGYSASTRAADFGAKSMREHLADSAAQLAVVVQIEDLAALDSVAEIAAVDGVDCVFVGRVDLAVAMQRDPSAREVTEAVAAICRAGKAAGCAVGLFVPSLDELPRWRAAGASLFMAGSDQGFIVSGARELAAALGTHRGGPR